MSPIAFQIPKNISVKQTDDFNGTFIFQPLEKGYGLTIGNALRRVMLSSLEGYAIHSIKIPGVYHEFATINGVLEDLTEIILNLKQIRFKPLTDTPGKTIFLSVSNKKVLKAGDLAEFTTDFQITNPELVICNIDESARFEIEITMAKGRGYVPADEKEVDSQAKGVILLDSIYLPVKKVNYHVENTRVGHKTDYEALILEVSTDGTIHPQDTIEHAATIMMQHFTLLIDKNKIIQIQDIEVDEVLDERVLKMRKLLKTPLCDMKLSVRAINCLKAAEIETLGDLVQRQMSDMAQFRNFGKKSLEELKALLSNNNLSFGMDVSIYKLK